MLIGKGELHVLAAPEWRVRWEFRVSTTLPSPGQGADWVVGLSPRVEASGPVESQALREQVETLQARQTSCRRAEMAAVGGGCLGSAEQRGRGGGGCGLSAAAAGGAETCWGRPTCSRRGEDGRRPGHALDGQGLWDRPPDRERQEQCHQGGGPGWCPARSLRQFFKEGRCNQNWPGILHTREGPGQSVSGLTVLWVTEPTVPGRQMAQGPHGTALTPPCGDASAPAEMTVRACQAARLILYRLQAVPA